MSYAIKTEELSKRFGRVQALNGLNLKVPEGAIYALVGPNGAGKTTTLKLLMNVLRPTIDFCINNGIIGTGGIRLCPDRVEALIYWKIGASGLWLC